MEAITGPNNTGVRETTRQSAMPLGARRFAVKVLVFFAPVVFFFGGIEWALWYVGESMPIAQIVELQRHHEVLWLRDYFDQGDAPYKRQAFWARRPEIIALGSSRVMKFRYEMFGKQGDRFYNCGGMIRSLPGLEKFTNSLSPATTPKVIILGVDPWWLNPSRHQKLQLQVDRASDWRAHVIAWRMALEDGKRLPKALLRPNFPHALGIRPRITGSGYRSDGSNARDYRDPSIPLPPEPLNDSWLPRIENGEEECPFSEGISTQGLARLEKVLRKLKSNGALVLVFAPPFSQRANHLLETIPGQKQLWSDYQRELPRLCTRLQLPFCGAYSPEVFGLSDTSMLDDAHAEETFHLHILKYWLQSPRVRRALPDTLRVVTQTLRSPKTDAWTPDFSASQKFAKAGSGHKASVR